MGISLSKISLWNCFLKVPFHSVNWLNMSNPALEISHHRWSRWSQHANTSPCVSGECFAHVFFGIVTGTVDCKSVGLSCSSFSSFDRLIHPAGYCGRHSICPLLTMACAHIFACLSLYTCTVYVPMRVYIYILFFLEKNIYVCIYICVCVCVCVHVCVCVCVYMIIHVYIHIYINNISISSFSD